jgi:hypothetical protein
VVRDGCKHVFYCWPLLVDKERDWLVKALNAEGVPVRAGEASGASVVAAVLAARAPEMSATASVTAPVRPATDCTGAPALVMKPWPCTKAVVASWVVLVPAPVQPPAMHALAALNTWRLLVGEYVKFLAVISGIADLAQTERGGWR